MENVTTDNKQNQISVSTNFSNLIIGLLLVIIAILTFNFFRSTTPIDESNSESQTIVPVVTQIPNDSSNNNQSKQNEYIVEKGDSLWKIAQKMYNNGFLWTEIAKTNNIINSNKLEIGSKLVLPEVASSQIIVDQENTNNNSSTNQNIEYTVKKGDTLWKIAQNFYGTGFQWEKIYNYPDNNLTIYTAQNGSKYPKIEVGMLLVIPN